MSKRARNVVQFADWAPSYAPAVRREQPAMVILLPIVRAESYEDRMERHDRSIAPVFGRPLRPRRRKLPPAFIDKPCDT
jgi:hypothetical protein